MPFRPLQNTIWEGGRDDDAALLLLLGPDIIRVPPAPPPPANPKTQPDPTRIFALGSMRFRRARSEKACAFYDLASKAESESDGDHVDKDAMRGPSLSLSRRDLSSDSAPSCCAVRWRRVGLSYATAPPPSSPQPPHPPVTTTGFLRRTLSSCSTSGSPDSLLCSGRAHSYLCVPMGARISRVQRNA
ncbi:hypothetical protein NL676_039404 [Syzygium grande]|nr:hypothetical protein NL676_039404 [Syzygium grande]